MSSSTWVPLLVAGVGVLGTLVAGFGGVLITQRWSDRRDEKTWERERERERERWSREDEARTFEHRREAYMDFYLAVKAMGVKAFERSFGFLDEGRLSEDWHSDASDSWRECSCMQIAPLHLLHRPPSARPGLGACSARATTPADEDDVGEDEHAQKYQVAERKLFVLIRERLSIPEVDASLPLPGYSFDELTPDDAEPDGAS